MTTSFDGSAIAERHARQHLHSDDAVREIHYLPTNASEREIRFIEINEFLGDRTDDILVPIDFGFDRGLPTAHCLVVLDVTPSQWERIRSGEPLLPDGWTLDGNVAYTRES